MSAMGDYGDVYMRKDAAGPPGRTKAQNRATVQQLKLVSKNYALGALYGLGNPGCTTFLYGRYLGPGMVFFPCGLTPLQSRVRLTCWSIPNSQSYSFVATFCDHVPNVDAENIMITKP